jgi:hypothetical protein
LPYDTAYAMQDDGLYSVALSPTVQSPVHILGSTSTGYQDGVGTAAIFRKPKKLAPATEGGKLFLAESGNDAIRILDIATSSSSTLYKRPPLVKGEGGGELHGERFVDVAVAVGGPSRLLTSCSGILCNTILALHFTPFNQPMLPPLAPPSPFTPPLPPVPPPPPLLPPPPGPPPYTGPPFGTLTHIAGSLDGLKGIVDGVGTNAAFSSPKDVVAMPDGLFAVTFDSGHCRLRSVELATGTVRALAGQEVVHCPEAGTCDPASGDGSGTGACFTNWGDGLGVTSDGATLVLADYTKLRTITVTNMSVAWSATSTTLAGSWASGASDGTGTSATFSQLGRLVITPNDEAALVVDKVDPISNLAAIRKVMLGTGDVSFGIGIVRLD